MINDKAKTSGNTEVAAMTSKQIIERNTNGLPAPAAPPAPPPWTAEFDLPSVRFPDTKRDQPPAPAARWSGAFQPRMPGLQGGFCRICRPQSRAHDPLRPVREREGQLAHDRAEQEMRVRHRTRARCNRVR